MRREDLSDLHLFLAVAEERSFTRAAARLGLSQSALSHAIRRFEARLGLRLFTRTTRAVAPTEAGQRLWQSVGPRLQAIDADLTALLQMRDEPAGTVRITTGQHAFETILWPAIERLVPDYPDVRFEVTLDFGLADLVQGRFDAGIRLGEQVGQDMIAVSVGPDMCMVVVGTPSYLAERPRPMIPQDLAGHACINLHLPSYGGLYAWEFEKEGRVIRARVEGPLVFNEVGPVLKAALAGFGLAYVPQDLVQSHLEAGRLLQVLEDWCPPFAGYHLYYPSRRQMAPALALLVHTLQRRNR